jgi:peptide deformylase
LVKQKKKKVTDMPAPAGNHAQGVALAAKTLGIKAKIVMPVPTPAIKVRLESELLRIRLRSPLILIPWFSGATLND